MTLYQKNKFYTSLESPAFTLSKFFLRDKRNITVLAKKKAYYLKLQLQASLTLGKAQCYWIDGMPN